MIAQAADTHDTSKQFLQTGLAVPPVRTRIASAWQGSWFPTSITELFLYLFPKRFIKMFMSSGVPLLRHHAATTTSGGKDE